jgi:hypothetical protein
MAKNGGQKNAMSISADAGKAHLRAHLSLYFFGAPGEAWLILLAERS